MNLSEYDRKYVRIEDKNGESFSGLADYESREFLECEYGGTEDGIFIEGFLIYRSQIESIEEVEVHGTVELWTENLILRRFRVEDAEPLYQNLGTDPEISKDPGWNPYATPELARETVRGFIDRYEDAHSYSWVIEIEDLVVGTIGAYEDKQG